VSRVVNGMPKCDKGPVTVSPGPLLPHGFVCVLNGGVPSGMGGPQRQSPLPDTLRWPFPIEFSTQADAARNTLAQSSHGGKQSWRIVRIEKLKSSSIDPPEKLAGEQNFERNNGLVFLGGSM
jgi:hypothetical protein